MKVTSEKYKILFILQMYMLSLRRDYEFMTSFPVALIKLGIISIVLNVSFIQYTGRMST